MKKYILNIFVALVLGICFSLVMLQQSTYVKEQVIGRVITLLEKEWDCKISIKKQYLNFFTASIILEKGDVAPAKHPNTTWGFEHAKISFGLLDALLKHKAALYLTFYNVHGRSITTSSGLEIIDHLIDILSPKNPDLPVSIKKVFISEGKVAIAHRDYLFDLAIHGSFSYGRIIKDDQKIYQGCILLNKTDINLNNKPFLSGISGSNIFYRGKGEKNWHISLHNSFKQLGNDTPLTYVLTGSWYQENKTFLLQEETHALNLKATLQKSSLRVEGSTPVQMLGAVYDAIKPSEHQLAKHLGGQCTLDITLDKHPTANFLCRGIISLDHPRFKDTEWEHLLLKNLYINQDIASADLYAAYSQNYAVQGTGNWYFDQQKGSCSLANSTEIITARRSGSPIYWAIPAQQASLRLDINHELKVEGAYSAVLHHSINAETRDINGSISATSDAFSITGKAQSYAYTLQGKLGLHPYLINATCTAPDETEALIDFRVQDDEAKTLRGYAKYSLLQSFLPLDMRDKVLGKNNKIYLDLQQNQLNPLQGTLWTRNSRFFIPSVQNMIKEAGLGFSIDTTSKKITIRDAHICFARGDISIPFATCDFQPGSFDIQNLYAPLSVNNLLINLKRDFYSFIYGNLLLQQHPEKPLNLSGTVVLHKTLVKGDVFNDSSTPSPSNPLEKLQQLNKGLDFSIRLINEKPIIIKTPTIEALAHVDLQTHHKGHETLAQLPHVSGTINIDNGNLKFLENTLKIEYGKIQFLTRQLDDPIIDIIAKNRINKYVVTLQVTGSLQKPTVILESTPELSEEQVLGLLFTGSENATLQTDLPVMIMQNLNTILLGHRKPYDKTSMLLDTLSKPFKYVQITPDFADQSGRSSVRAQVSVPLGKQLKAQFQKNLTFDEDLNVEIDYLLSDDINLKLVKDQRGELGSEVEVRFKF